MVSPSEGSVVLVRFPFSDLSASKLRPAIVLARVGRDDWVLCQITSNAYADPMAVKILDEHFQTGSLQRPSYVRPGKLFTANSSLMAAELGKLNAATFQQVVTAIVALFQRGLSQP